MKYDALLGDLLIGYYIYIHYYITVYTLLFTVMTVMFYYIYDIMMYYFILCYIGLRYDAPFHWHFWFC